MFVEIEGVSGRAPTLVNPEHVVSITRPGNYTAVHLVNGSEVNTDLDPKTVAMRFEKAAPTLRENKLTRTGSNGRRTRRETTTDLLGTSVHAKGYRLHLRPVDDLANLGCSTRPDGDQVRT